MERRKTEKTDVMGQMRNYSVERKARTYSSMVERRNELDQVEVW